MEKIEWAAFTYSLPAKSGSSARVALWRRLRRFGAISPAGGLHLLPANDEGIEAFNWLAGEVHQAGGEALTFRVGRFEGLSDEQIIAMFNTARRAEYAELSEQVAVLDQSHGADMAPEVRDKAMESLARLRRRHAEIARVDYFGCPAGQELAARLTRLAATLFADEGTTLVVAPVIRDQYLARRWVTRPRPHVDRLACAWLIRRFINPQAPIRYAITPEPDEVAFDMNIGPFAHIGNLCTFETMLLAFELDDPVNSSGETALRSLAEIVHEIDLRDGRYLRPETAGLAAILDGWQRAGLSDREMETHGIIVFEALYTALHTRLPGGPVSQEQPV